MRNGHYNVVGGSKDGDCLFEVLATAFRQVGMNTNVSLLRKQVGNAVTPAVFEYYKTIFSTYASNVAEDAMSLRKLREQHNRLKDRLKGTTAHSVQLDIIGEAKGVEDLHRDKKFQYQTGKEMLEEYRFMEKVATPDEFKVLVESCDFWADTWALSVLEAALDVKLIVLSEDAYLSGNINDVLECGVGLHTEISPSPPASPEKYIILGKSGKMYNLITYRERGIFTYLELPYTLRTMIATKCVEMEQSAYSLIQEFSDLRAELGIEDGEANMDELQAGGADCEKNIIFVIDAASRSKDRPGCGPGEEIPVSLIHEFGALAATPGWRSTLSDDHECDLTIAGRTWPSVTHYVEGSKFKKENPEFAALFSVESKSDISRDPGLARAIGSGLSQYKGMDINTGRVKADRDFFRGDGKGRGRKEYELALRTRAGQDKDFRKALLDSKRAKLVSRRVGRPPKVERELMSLRSTLE
jgi:hypothetical protein